MSGATTMERSASCNSSFGEKLGLVVNFPRNKFIGVSLGKKFGIAA